MTEHDALCRGWMPSRLIHPYLTAFLERERVGHSLLEEGYPVLEVLAERSGISEKTLYETQRGGRTWISIAKADALMCAMGTSFLAWYRDPELRRWYLGDLEHTEELMAA